MTLEQACKITGIRPNEISRICHVALVEILEAEKATPESDYILKYYTKAEYVEAYERILKEAERI